MAGRPRTGKGGLGSEDLSYLGGLSMVSDGPVKAVLTLKTVEWFTREISRHDVSLRTWPALKYKEKQQFRRGFACGTNEAALHRIKNNEAQRKIRSRCHRLRIGPYRLVWVLLDVGWSAP